MLHQSNSKDSDYTPHLAMSSYIISMCTNGIMFAYTNSSLLFLSFRDLSLSLSLSMCGRLDGYICGRGERGGGAESVTAISSVKALHVGILLYNVDHPLVKLWIIGFYAQNSGMP